MMLGFIIKTDLNYLLFEFLPFQGMYRYNILLSSRRVGRC